MTAEELHKKGFNTKNMKQFIRSTEKRIARYTARHLAGFITTKERKEWDAACDAWDRAKRHLRTLKEANNQKGKYVA